MDTNRDGIIDDPLATKKRGRKPLGLTPDEMKARREEQRQARVAKKRDDKRWKDIEELVIEISYLRLMGKTNREIGESLFNDRTLTVSYNKNLLAGYKGGRLHRPRGI